MQQEELKEKVKELALLEKEGTYWDFKREPHKNNAKLLHDILCLANAIYNGDRYLIIGIDEDNDYQRYNLNHDDVKKRKTQADLMDFLSKIDFAGHIVPDIKLETLYYENNVEIDVIIIKNKPEKPYILSEDYKYKSNCIRNGVVYSRINDKNVPMRESANIYIIEKMWRERFGLDDRPLERLEKLLLEPDNWENNFGSDTEHAYHKTSPEFNIKQEELQGMLRKNSDSFRFFFLKSKSYVYRLSFFYYNTLLKNVLCASLYKVRGLIPFPHEKSINKTTDNIADLYYCYLKNNFNGKSLFFLQNGYNLNGNRAPGKIPIPIFENEEEMNNFINSLDLSKFKDKSFDFSKYISRENLIKAENSSGASVKTTIKIYELYQDWKGHKQLNK